MIVAMYIKEHSYLFDGPQTINFGGKYLYEFEEKPKNKLLIKAKENLQYIKSFFDIAESSSKVDLVSAIVGENGVGKTSILNILRENSDYKLLDNKVTDFYVVYEIDGKIEVASEDSENIILQIYNASKDKYETSVIGKYDKKQMSTLYYSPHFDLKYHVNNHDKYDLSLDKNIYDDLSIPYNEISNQRHFHYHFYEELKYRNVRRQMDFLRSEIFQGNRVFREVLNLPKYNKFKLELIFKGGDGEYDTYNVPHGWQGIISSIEEKVEKEGIDWGEYKRNLSREYPEEKRDALTYRYLLNNNLIKSLIGIIKHQINKANTFLYEGKIDNWSSDNSRTAKEEFLYFIEHAYIEIGENRFNKFELNLFTDLIETIESLPLNEKFKNNEFDNEELENEEFENNEFDNNEFENNESDNEELENDSIEIYSIETIDKLLELQRGICRNLSNYYSRNYRGNISSDNKVDTIYSIGAIDKKLSSGETALLNFFSSLYYIINYNLSEEFRSLDVKENYILLLDEIDLTCHPIWKKKLLLSILETIPYFFPKGTRLQIIFTTHDPLTLSDMPNNNVVFLRKNEKGKTIVLNNEDKARPRKTFGANITDILSNAFFVEDGLIGDFAKHKIEEVIYWINKEKQLQYMSKNDADKAKFKEELAHYKKVVALIDEPVIRRKLTEMITDLAPDNKYYNDAIEAQIKYLQSLKK